jgi:hypothetical protein
MRTSIMMSLALLSAVTLPPRLVGQELQKNTPAVCGEHPSYLSDSYEAAVLSLIEPPNWKNNLIRIMVGNQIKIGLWTDGEKFKLWAGSPDIPQKNIYEFLEDLDEACHLLPDPRHAVDLIKFKWESKDLTAAQFAQLHRDFTKGLSQYGSTIQGRYAGMLATRTWVIHLDAIQYSVIYDNSFEHVELRVWEDIPL